MYKTCSKMASMIEACLETMKQKDLKIAQLNSLSLKKDVSESHIFYLLGILQHI